MGPPSSWSGCGTVNLRKTTSTGSGSPALEPTPRHTSGFSTRSPRARNSTRTEPTSAVIPELTDVPLQHLHEPWKDPAGLPAGYPEPIVDHAVERREALNRYAAIKRG